MLLLLLCGVSRKCFYGGVDIPLSEKGKNEARDAAIYLGENEVIDVIWSSPLSRAIFGAERIAEKQGLSLGSIQKDTGFVEVGRGDWVGKNEAEIGDEALKRWNSDPAFWWALLYLPTRTNPCARGPPPLHLAFLLPRRVNFDLTMDKS